MCCSKLLWAVFLNNTRSKRAHYRTVGLIVVWIVSKNNNIFIAITIIIAYLLVITISTQCTLQHKRSRTDRPLRFYERSEGKHVACLCIAKTLNSAFCWTFYTFYFWCGFLLSDNKYEYEYVCMYAYILAFYSVLQCFIYIYKKYLKKYSIYCTYPRATTRVLSLLCYSLFDCLVLKFYLAMGKFVVYLNNKE